jgi:hypothetical protein
MPPSFPTYVILKPWPTGAKNLTLRVNESYSPLTSHEAILCHSLISSYNHESLGLY